MEKQELIQYLRYLKSAMDQAITSGTPINTGNHNLDILCQEMINQKATLEPAFLNSLYLNLLEMDAINSKSADLDHFLAQFNPVYITQRNSYEGYHQRFYIMQVQNYVDKISQQ